MDLKPRLRDVVIDAVSDAMDLELVSSNPISEGALRDCGADVVIAAARQLSDRRMAARLLAIAPRMRVLTVAVNGRSAATWELRLNRTLHRSITRAGLIDAIRQSVQGREEV
jgi:hypothetical protein